MPGTLRAIVLGSAAGGGVPQWNCRCPICELAWAGDPRVSARTQASLAVSADGLHWLLVNAAPDLRQQILATPALHPAQPLRHSPIAAVVLTSGDVDAVAGLLHLRERQPFDLWATAAIHDILSANDMFRALDRQLVRRCELALGEDIPIGLGLVLRAFALPGKTPLYREGDEVVIGEESEGTIGLAIEAGRRRIVYAPACAALPPRVVAGLADADLLFFDGTAFHDDDLVRLGVSGKTAHRMGHVAMAGPAGSLAAFRDARIGRKVFIHLNNTNPVLVEGSPERKAVEAAGWEVAHDGMEIALACN